MRKKNFNHIWFMHNTRGLSLIEVLASLAIAAVSIGLFTHYAILTAGGRGDIERQKLVKETLLNNLIEIKGNPIAGLPAANHCRIRKYNNLGAFVSESIVNNVLDHCGLAVVDPNYYFVFSKVLPASSISATFTIPASMKLPSYSSMIYQVNLQSIFKSKSGVMFKDEISFIKR